MARLKELYEKEIKKFLKESLKIKNDMAVPRLKKITINMGVGKAAQEKGKIEGAVSDMKLITGQQPIVTKARKSVAGFKLREGSNVGVKVTLRKARMYEFLDRLVNIALPRVRDFRGLSKKSFDGKGNYSLGLKEQIVFPEIDYDNLDELRGMDITIVTSARDDKESLELLKKFNLPINI
ncbi:50S ribosomal protein L5 [Alphaproteobacteria bacterium]|nr:50S ribosomal protein L5 [Alphaproteobacteria bacterium]